MLIRIISTSRCVRMSPWPEPRVLKWQKSWLLIQKLMWMPGAQNLKDLRFVTTAPAFGGGELCVNHFGIFKYFFVLSFPLWNLCKDTAMVMQVKNPHRLATPYLYLSTECECFLVTKVRDINDCLSLQLFSTVLILAWFLSFVANSVAVLFSVLISLTVAESQTPR